MKYSTTIALFIGLVSADYGCAPCTDSLCIKNENDHGVRDHTCDTAALSRRGVGAGGSLGAYANHFLQSDLSNDDSSIGFGDNGRQHHKIVDDDASRVKAHYESCHVGERIIPAIKEESQI